MRLSDIQAARMLLRELTSPAAAPTKPPCAGKSTDVSRNVNACRCLFGRPSSDVSPVQACLDESSRRRWNFDFAAMQPLARGRYEWTVSCRRAADTQFPVPLATSSDASPQAAAAAAAADAAGLRATDAADDELQFASSSCRLLRPPTATPVPFSGSGYIATPCFTT